VTEETVYSSAPALATPRRFVRDAASDLGAVPSNAWRLFKRSMQARHRRSRLGYVWLFIPIAATSLVWLYISHVRLLRFPEPEVSQLAYVVSGVLLWQLFLEALQAPITQLTASRAVLTKSRLPHETWLAASCLEVLLSFALRLIVVLVVVIAATGGLRWSMLLVPVGALSLLLLGFALGLALAPVGLLYDDVGQGLLVVAGFWFLLTPVVYAPPTGGSAATLVDANPVTPLLVTTRAWLTGGSADSAAAFLAVVAGASLVLIVSLGVYRLARPHVVARL
jgi:lipopolysaccharide transport system permease protein